jgi:hypothetical protein
VTCGFGRSPKFFLTGLLGFLLGHLCDVDHMESRGVWCRTAVCSVKAVTRDVLTVEKVGAHLGPVGRGARTPAQIHHVCGPVPSADWWLMRPPRLRSQAAPRPSSCSILATMEDPGHMEAANAWSIVTGLRPAVVSQPPE